MAGEVAADEVAEGEMAAGEVAAGEVAGREPPPPNRDRRMRRNMGHPQAIRGRDQPPAFGPLLM